MKKLLASLMALSMVFAVTGCSESNDSENGNLVVITYGASENAYSKLSDEFKTVLDNFELK